MGDIDPGLSQNPRIIRRKTRGDPGNGVQGQALQGN